MQQAIDIPSPSGADTETVVTALETAAIFRAKGDSHEAMRWLRRAAESAGAAGDDERALSLSRIAAELQDELSAVQPTASRVTPSPPSANVSYPPPPSSRAPRPSSVPRPSQAPRPSSGVASRPPLALVPSPAVAPEPPPLPELPPLPEPPAAPAEKAHAQPEASELSPPPPSLRPAIASTGARHAARVAVAISTTKVGYLEVRLLAEGEAPRLGSSEAVLVMLDPTSTLLAR